MADNSQYPHASSPAARAVMLGNRRRDTRPERAVRSLLHRRGYRFRKDYPLQVGTVRTRPDIVFLGSRLAVFVDGCFWHRCPHHGTTPATNSSYWVPKLKRNVVRDARVNEALEHAGWTVVRIWEHVEPADAADRVEQALTELAD